MPKNKSNGCFNLSISAAFLFAVLLFSCGGAKTRRAASDTLRNDHADVPGITGSAEWKDGVYPGESSGWPLLKVEVEIISGMIKDVRIISDNSTPEWAEQIKEEMPARIIKKNSADADVITGATLSSESFMRAVRNALEKAGK